MHLRNFPYFPIRESVKIIKEKISIPDFKNLENLWNKTSLIKLVTGQNLGTYDVSILLPQK